MPFFHVEASALREDGAIIAKAQDSHNWYGDEIPEAPPLILEIAPDGASFRRYGRTRQKKASGYGTSHAQASLSPTGRYLVRPHDGTILLTEPGGEAVADLQALGETPDHELIQALQHVRLHGVYEVWDAAPLAFRTRFIVRSMPLMDCLGDAPPTEEGVTAEMSVETARRRFERLREIGAKAEDIKSALVELDRVMKVRHAFIMARWLIKAAAHYARAAPFGAWSPDDPAFIDLEKPEAGRASLATYIPLGRVRGELHTWLDDDAFLVRFADGKQMRVTVDGGLGDLQDTPPRTYDEPGTIPKALLKQAKAVIRDASVAAFQLVRLDEAACIAAIRELAGRLRADAENVFWGNEMKLRFLHPEGEMDEEAFFAFVGEHCGGAAPALRDLMAAFDGVAWVQDVWSTELVSAGGFPAAALARVDPQSHVALEGYFRRRDPGHEPHGYEVVFPALGPARSMEALRVGLVLWLGEQTEGVSGHGKAVARRLLAEARDMCVPEAFLAEAGRVVAGRFADENEEQPRDEERADAIADLLRGADRKNAWDKKLIALARQAYRF
jgi:hypothetical protein